MTTSSSDRALPLETNLERIAALTNQQRDDNEAFAYYIETMWERDGRSDAELDHIVEAITAEVTPRINCTACANCCRSMQVGLVPADIPVLARALDQPPEQVIASCIDFDTAAQSEEWGVINRSPCLFLSGTLCAVYEHRPAACRVYPGLTPDFRWLALPLMEGAGKCPIIFNVIERLKIALGW